MAGLGKIGKAGADINDLARLLNISPMETLSGGVPIRPVSHESAAKRLSKFESESLPPDVAQFWEGSPRDIVLSQYPPELRSKAMPEASGWDATGRGSELSWGSIDPENPNHIIYQPRAMGGDDLRSLIAEVREPRLPSGDYGTAVVSMGTPGHAGLIAVASNRPIGALEGTLFHENRHLLEGSQSHYLRKPGKGINWGPKYFGRMNEEAVRFADARARYAQATGKIIDNIDEAERAAEMIFKNKDGVGAGFAPDAREFYGAARAMSPAARARQNYILQKLLMGAPVAAGLVTEE